MDVEIDPEETVFRYFTRYENLSIVDSHVHIWAPHRVDRPWPRVETAKPHTSYMGTARYGMTKEMLVVAMDSAGVDRTVLIPPSWEGHYNDLALDAVKHFPHRFAVMGRIFLEKPMSQEEFDLWRNEQGMLGIRCIFHSARYQQLLVDGSFDWLWPLAEKNNMPISVMMPGMDNAREILEKLLRTYPALKISLDHLNIQNSDVSHIDRNVAQFSSLAKYQNFAVKTSAVPSWSKQDYPFRDTHDYLKKLFDVFGPDRMFWGSDFTRLNIHYRIAVCQFVDGLEWLRGSDLQSVMGRGICKWLNWDVVNTVSD